MKKKAKEESRLDRALGIGYQGLSGGEGMMRRCRVFREESVVWEVVWMQTPLESVF